MPRVHLIEISLYYKSFFAGAKIGLHSMFRIGGVAVATQARKHSNLKMRFLSDRPLLAGAIILCSLGLAVVLNRDLSLQERQILGDKSRDAHTSASFRWNPELFRWLSFGHVPSSVDWLLIRFLTDQNVLKTVDGVETEASRILHLATEIDPAFYSLYTAGSNFLAVVRGDRDGALRLIEKGHHFLVNEYPKYSPRFQAEHWPYPWRIGLIRGYMYLLEYQDVGRAVQAYSDMGKYPDVPEALKIRAANMNDPAHQFVLGMNSLDTIQRWAKDDPKAMGELEEKRKMLLLSKEIYFLNQEFRAFKPGKKDIAARWSEFRAKKNLSETDQLGGKFYVDSAGRVTSTTPRVPVLGITVD